MQKLEVVSPPPGQVAQASHICSIDNIGELQQGRVRDLLDQFRQEFGGAAGVVVRVPGRVNLIGEHIDYCGYAVHPMAIEQVSKQGRIECYFAR